MELKDYLLIVSKRLWLLIVSIVVVVVGVYFITVRQPESWDGSLMINIIKKAETTDTKNYQFDKFYAIQASGMFADTVVSWLSDPNLVISVYNKANIEVPNISISQLAKVFNARKVLPSSVQMQYTSANYDDIAPVLNAAGDLVKGKTQDLVKLDPTNNFDVKYDSPAVLKTPSNLVINLIIGFISGIFLGLILVFAIEYFRPSKKVSKDS